jgi:hypothetical protein
MSRTDKTKPFVIKLWHGDLARQARHHHGAGSLCDLPASLEEDLAAAVRGRCIWEFRWTGVRDCCCGLCRDQGAYRSALRGIRASDKTRLTSRTKAWNVGDEAAFDDVVPNLRYRR